ncbi:MAG: GTP 3',8-cyclase MoaA [Chloroflexi bacterium]|nr:GTP 3',8-cyclase MoaA [Chloroflexota bacterium]MCC6893108.1 GTP 3',8-cyclase MoaA [Anaerolineae bacterium]
MAEAIRDTFNRPLRDLRISVTDRCNFRCAYCMPAEIFGEHYRFLPKPEILTYEEITRLTGIIVRLGAVKLRITGGEPLVREELETLIAMLRPIDGVDDLTLTTNGYLLPKKAQLLKDAGLNRITVSLDSLDDDVFRRMNGNRSSVQKVLDGIAAAELAGLQPIKINCVVQRGVNDHTIVDLARWAKDKGYILRFIEYMDVGNKNGWRMDEVVPAQEIVDRIDAAMPLTQTRRNYQSEVALRYRYQDGAGEIGVIASVTKPFCGACSRMRLSPEGSLYTCLFATQGTDLRAPLRDGATDDEIEAIIRDTWGSRIDRYSEVRFEQTDEDRAKKVEMYHIGG